jgi:1-deoxy-D-xylulose-5-phosphate synthase
MLELVHSVEDLRKLSVEDLPELGEDLRKMIIDVISTNGGHIASSLGVVELTMVLHYIYNTPVDRIIWDVGHQTYAHKILTGRKDQFHTIRKHGGLSGFPKREESEFDTYNVGHSSTSISLAVGEAVARDLRGDDYNILAVIGDGSLTSGMAWEGLNQLGHSDINATVILNDNDHSISENVGAVSEYLTRVITGQLYNEMRTISQRIIRSIPFFGKILFNLMRKTSLGIKGVFVPGQLFEDMGLRYFGPVDGHNIELLAEVMESLKGIEGPKLVHVITKKGKGYENAECDPTRFHGIGSFDVATGKSPEKKGEGWSSVAGRTLAHLAKNDSKIIAITAAMKLGTGLAAFEEIAPERIYDVGIAEQHAITFASALASSGKKPFVLMYSTFLQRAVDQVIHDIAIMKHPVKILVDRAGVVGDDGETHHGMFDIALFKNVPGFILIAPSKGEELRDAILFSANYSESPVMVRYPRGIAADEPVDVSTGTPLELGKSRVLSRGKDVLIMAVGDMVSVAINTAELLKEKGLEAGVVNLLFLAPLDMETINREVADSSYSITLENGIEIGGIGQQITAQLPSELRSRVLFNGGFPREFVVHGSVDLLMKKNRLDPESLAERILSKMNNFPEKEE